MCQLEKPRANEITAFTVCKLELRGKAIVLKSRSSRTRFNRQLWEKRKESDVLSSPSSEQKQTKEQVPRGFKETHVLAVINKGQNDFHKTKPNRGEGAAA